MRVSIRSLWNSFKRSNICITEVPEWEENKQDIGNLFEKMKETFPNLVKEIDMQVQEESPKQVGPKEQDTA